VAAPWSTVAVVSDNDPGTIASLGSGPTDPGPALELELEGRYKLGGTLGRGGMGEVRLAHDVRIDRDVAVKLMRPEQRDDDTIARFFLEARVQGRLDHPAVVPVHDLGMDRHDNPYFVMKRVTGTTLAEVLARSSSDPALRDKWSRRQLLAQFIDVCLAIELAHTRGVIHRDLKPANIMLGDFGEVYVLDWGLARIVDDAARPPQAGTEPSSANDAGMTVAGALLGTPGYMAPEQVRGTPVDPGADVFALGCILYEIITGYPALPRGPAAFERTLDAQHHRPSERHPELAIPPELDDLCAQATAAESAARPTARAVAAAVQHYLDGDRDLARRIELAREHAARARQALVDPSDDARAIAMREAGRALALDPNNDDAQGVLAHLMLEAPRTIPAEAIVAADAERAASRNVVLQWIWKAYAVVGLMMAMLLGFPIRHVVPVVALGVLLASAGFVAWLTSRRPLPMRSPIFIVAIWLNAATLACASLVLGPLLIVPIFLIMSLAGMLSQPSSYRSAVIVVPHALAVALPLALEWIGILPSTYRIAGGLLFTPPAIELSQTLATTLVVVSIAAGAIIMSWISISLRVAQQRAQDQVHAQTWHLKQLLPTASGQGRS
jgi:serine/threonine-protein kinase